MTSSCYLVALLMLKGVAHRTTLSLWTGWHDESALR
jgi:hypothetical protein